MSSFPFHLGTFLLIILFSAFPSIAVWSETQTSLCQGADATLKCLKEKFQLLEAQADEQFYEILHNAEKKAEECADLSATAQFLELALVRPAGAEFLEYIAEEVETLCVSNTGCCLDAALLLHARAQKDLMKELQTPTFLIDTLPPAFSAYKQNEKYKKLLEYYFKK